MPSNGTAGHEQFGAIIPVPTGLVFKLFALLLICPLELIW